MTCQLFWVPPGNLAEVWPKVESLIREAMRRGNLSRFSDVVQSLADGHSTLWVACEDQEIIAAAVARIAQTEWRRVCEIVALGGKDRGKWLSFEPEIERWAREQSCSAMRIMGRKGWAKVLPDYRVTRIVLEKEL